jgi:hypothetical protein
VALEGSTDRACPADLDGDDFGNGEGEATHVVLIDPVAHGHRLPAVPGGNHTAGTLHSVVVLKREPRQATKEGGRRKRQPASAGPAERCPLAAADSVQDALDRVLDGYVDFAAGSPSLVSVLISEVINLPAEIVALGRSVGGISAPEPGR